MLYRSLIACLLLVSLSGCSDPKEASESNFKKSLQAYLDSEYPKCYFLSEIPKAVDLPENSKILQRYEVMVKAGLLEKSTTEIEVGGGRSAPEKKTVPYYALSAEGKKQFTENVKSISGRNVGGFCGGKASIVEVLQFTEPHKVWDETVTDVVFSYTVIGMPEWTKNEAVLAQFSDIKADLGSVEEPVKDKTSLVLTNSGWTHRTLRHQ